MAATRKTSGAAKKGGVKKAGAKKSVAEKGGAKRAAGSGKATGGAKKSGGGRGGGSQGKCLPWKVWRDHMPPAKPQVHVIGKCTFPTTGFKVKLVKAVPQGINPAILLLRKVVTPPAGFALPIKTAVDIRYDLTTTAIYTHVTILPEVVTAAVQVF